MRKIVLAWVALFVVVGLNAQNSNIKINGEIMPYMIDDCGDTLILAQLEEVSVSSFRRFKTKEEYKLYRRYRHYAVKVYPYAVEAIKIFREVEYATNNMKKRHRRKHIRKLHKKLKKEFTTPLKKLTKTQGRILMKMIEKELNRPMFYLIKDLRGGLAAAKWGTLGRFFGHRLKEGYKPGVDPIMDAVLNDMNISYELTRK